MLPVESTYEILAFKALDRSVDEKWVIWAIDMLEAGFDTEHLRILAGAEKPYNQFYFQDLTERVLRELGLDYSNTENTLDNYIVYLVRKALKGEMNFLTVLSFVSNIHTERYHNTPYQDFYFLYYAKQDLLVDTVQWYWPDTDRSNIDEIIIQYFKKWVAENNYKT